MNIVYDDARDAVFQAFYKIALEDKRVILLSVDTGALLFKKFKEEIPKQFFNVGVAEQNAISVAAGLALTGKHVFVFGISNFVTLRCFEQIKIDLCCMRLPVTILGMGSGYIYSSDGPTHHMIEDLAIMRTLPGVTIWSISDNVMASAIVDLAHKTEGPSYIRFDKGPFAQIYKDAGHNFCDGLSILRRGKDITIISTGIMVTQAFFAADELGKYGIDAGIIDFYRLKPANKTLFLDTIKDAKRLITLEENAVIGGLGSLVSKILTENHVNIPVKILGIRDVYRCDVGSRDTLRRLDGIDVLSIVDTIKNWG